MYSYYKINKNLVGHYKKHCKKCSLAKKLLWIAKLWNLLNVWLYYKNEKTDVLILVRKNQPNETTKFEHGKYKAYGRKFEVQNNFSIII